MGKIKKKTPRPKRNTYTAELAKPRKMAGNARAQRSSGKRTGKRRAIKQPGCLTQDEKDRFFRTIKNPRDLALFKIAYHCALRASEVGMLDLDDYRRGPNLNTDRIKITRLKGSVSGEMYVTPAAAKCVRAWLRKRGQAPGPLFRSRQGCRGVSRARVFGLFRQYAAAACLPMEKRHPHILKHSAVTHLLEMGESIIDTQRHAGHSSIGSTMRYVNLGSGFEAARAKRLADWR
jgi:integrase